MRRLTRRALLRATAAAACAVGGVASVARLANATATPPADQRATLGNLTLVARANPWQLSLLDPNGQTLWDEDLNQPLGYMTQDGQVHRAQRLTGFSQLGPDAVRILAETDDPTMPPITIDVRSISDGALHMSVTPDPSTNATSVLGGISTQPDERFVGFGERFDGVNQRGRKLDVWA